MATIPPLKIEIGDGLLLWHMKKKWNFGWWNPPVFHGYPNQIVDEEYGKPQKATPTASRGWSWSNGMDTEWVLQPGSQARSRGKAWNQLPWCVRMDLAWRLYHAQHCMCVSIYIYTCIYVYIYVIPIPYSDQYWGAKVEITEWSGDCGILPTTR